MKNVLCLAGFLCVSAKVLQIVTGAFIGTLNHWVSLGFIFFVCWGWGCFGVFFIKMSLPKQTKSFKVSKGRGDGGSSRAMTVFSLFVAIEFKLINKTRKEMLLFSYKIVPGNEFAVIWFQLGSGGWSFY